MNQLSIKKLHDGQNYYYPLVVDDALFICKEIKIEHNIGKYKTGDTIYVGTRLSEVLENMLTGRYTGSGNGNVSIEIDETLNINSENAVTNKAITTEFNRINAVLDSIQNGDSDSKTVGELKEKVDEISTCLSEISVKDIASFEDEKDNLSEILSHILTTLNKIVEKFS